LAAFYRLFLFSRGAFCVKKRVGDVYAVGGADFFLIIDAFGVALNVYLFAFDGRNFRRGLKLGKLLGENAALAPYFGFARRVVADVDYSRRTVGANVVLAVCRCAF
jgi:hypothetical protein